MKNPRMVFAMIVWGLATIAPGAGAAAPEDSVVKVFSSVRLPNPVRPWAKQNATEFNGTGVVIDGKKVLTNAHLVLYASEVFVQGRQGGDRVEAKVAGVGPGIDLAVLTVDEADFFDKRPPLPRAKILPDIMASVLVYGYPIGGNGLSVTKGIVSRIDFEAFDYLTIGLRIQVDATINPGNSGGPAVVDGKMVGLVFGQAENIGYLIAGEEIDAFLDDLADGHYDGKPRQSHNEYQFLENEALRARLGLDKKTRGVMVREPARREPSYPLKEFDVITRIGDHAIDNEGMVPVRDNLRLSFEYFVPKLARDGQVPLRVIRNGQPLDVPLPVGRDDDRLIRDYRGRYPTYFLHGPLAFSPVAAEAIPWYFRMNPFLSGRRSPMTVRAQNRVAFPGEELVVVTAPMFSHKITKGYDEPFGLVVSAVNGVKVKNLRHLVETLRDSKEKYLTFRFAEDLSPTLVFRRQEMEAATETIMADNGIPRRGSPELMEVWEKQ
jgi:S1-C subfamily serine protease